MGKQRLIIDQGGHSTRVIVFNRKGKSTFYASEPVQPPFDSAIKGFAEYDPTIIIESTKQLLDRLPSRINLKKFSKIADVGIITQRSSLIACNRYTGEALTPMISWQDTRNEEWFNAKQIDQPHFQSLTGLHPSAHMGASKIRWLIDNDPKVRACLEADELVFMPWGAYFLQHLSTQFTAISDPLLAARTGLVHYGSMAWSDELLSLFDIPVKCLPQIVPSTHDYGEMLIGERLLPIHLLGGDQNFVAWAYGDQTSHAVIFLNIGTAAFAQATMKTDEKINDKLLKTIDAISPNKLPIQLKEGTVNTAANALHWWQHEISHHYSNQALNDLLETHHEAPIFINCLAGSGSPFWIKAQQPFFVEDITEYSNDQKTVAVLESILFACKINIDLLTKNNGEQKEIIASGGLVVLDALCQKLADLTQFRVIRHEDNEASARGAAFFMGDITQYKPSQEPHIFQPRSTQAKPLRERFQRYQSELEKLLIHTQK